jgi:hypothetical protein
MAFSFQEWSDANQGTSTGITDLSDMLDNPFKDSYSLFQLTVLYQVIDQ